MQMGWARGIFCVLDRPLVLGSVILVSFCTFVSNTLSDAAFTFDVTNLTVANSNDTDEGQASSPFRLASASILQYVSRRAGSVWWFKVKERRVGNEAVLDGLGERSKA